MSPALASLLALVAAIVISFTSRLNVGLVAIPMAWAVGIYAGSTPDVVLGGFPSSLFVTLAGVTLLFSLSEANGTVALFAHRLVAVARGSAKLVPPILFLIAGGVATVGPGAIASVALVAPMAMAIGRRAGVPPFLTALMVANGANAGNLSPLSAVGVIANTRMASVGLGGHEWKVFAANFLAHVFVTAVAYAVMVRALSSARVLPADRTDTRLSRPQWLTVGIVSLWVGAVTVAGAPIGLAAFAAAALLVMCRAADETAAIRGMPWTAILMVCGVTMLVTAAERAGGMQLFTALLSRLATPATLNGVIAFVTGVISTCSSTSGVVLPTFLPMAPGLVQQVGGGDPLAVALSINVGSSLVDVSPLSTLGALCVAAVMDPETGRGLFRTLLIWGLSMSLAGALMCQLFASAFAGL
ncbi:MAG TPA: SLC13 family permease [Vicinamibacterales bacterium]|nr:SLC13 family permease [Vicinamibacterales bacterium]